MDIIVIKVGGEALRENAHITTLGEALKTLRAHALPVVVHGGGVQISNLSARLGIKTRFHNGVRITEPAAMEAVEAALSSVNSRLVRAFNRAGVPAVGVRALDAELLVAEAQIVNGAPTRTAARVVERHPQVLLELAPRYTPVLSPIAVDSTGEALNLNADTAAIEIARAMGATCLLFLCGVDAVLDADTHRIATATEREIESLIARGVIHAGMIVKARAALEAVRRGVHRVCIGSCRSAHGLAQLMAGDTGTVIQ